MPSKDNKILEFNHYQKPDKIPFVTYAGVFHQKSRWIKNNNEKPSSIKVGENIPYKYSMSLIWACNDIENKYNVSRGEYCM